jgi:hypothetical protein
MTTEPESQSVLAISVPEAAPILALVRSNYDGEVPPIGVNAHVTIMYPWMPPALIDEQAINDLVSLFCRFSCFDFSLRIGWFGRHEVLLLVPEDDSPFVRMTEAVISRWPQYPYFGGEYSKIEPHVSLAWGEEGTLSRVAELIASHVPIGGHATVVGLSTGRPGFMTRRASFPLTPMADKGISV